jgi:ABC-type multidrug transport system fused ATPase/permease subunit
MFIVSLIQGLLQVLGVTSIFPFLALVADPEQFYRSIPGKWIQTQWGTLSELHLIYWAGILSILFLFTANASLLLGEVMRANYVHGLGHWLRTRLLAQMLSNPYSYFLRFNTGELLKKAAGDVMTFVVGVLAPFLEFLTRALTLVLLIVAIFIIDARICVVMGSALGLFYLISYGLMRPLRSRTSDGLKIANRGAMREALQALGGIKPIKLNSVESYFLNRYSHWSAEQARLSKWIPVISNSPRYLIEPLAYGALVAMALYTQQRGIALGPVIPTMGVIALAGYRLVPNLQIMYGCLTGISTSMHALEEIRDELEDCVTGNSPRAKLNETSPFRWNRELRLKVKRFQYKDSAPSLLENINLIIPRNSFVALTGETGCGKSTLVDLLLGLHTAEAVQLFADGLIIEGKSLTSFRASIGVVPQEVFLMDDTLAANVAFGLPTHEINWERVREVLKIAQLPVMEIVGTGLALGTRVGERGVRLSGGQKQRIGLARALYRKPEMLIMDEATSALDSETETALLRAIECIRNQITLFVITHRATTIENADIVYHLSRGQLQRTASAEYAS